MISDYTDPLRAPIKSNNPARYHTTANSRMQGKKEQAKHPWLMGLNKFDPMKNTEKQWEK